MYPYVVVARIERGPVLSPRDSVFPAVGHSRLTYNQPMKVDPKDVLKNKSRNTVTLVSAIDNNELVNKATGQFGKSMGRGKSREPQ